MDHPELAGADSHLDRLLTTSNLDEPWFKSIVRGVREHFHPPQLPPLELTSKPVEDGDLGGMSVVEQSWFKAFFTNLKDAIRPPKLPPLEVTSKPVQVGSIWGAYGGGESRSKLISVGIHVGIVALMLLIFQTPVMRKVVQQAIVLYDPVRLPPAAIKPAGGGGMHMQKPISKGAPPKPAIKQFVPPTPPIVKPKLAVDPTIAAAPPEIKADNYADPLAKAMDFSGGRGSRTGMGDGQNGGLGNGSGASSGNGAYRIGGDVSAPVVISKVEPEYSEEARKAKFSGSVLLSLVIDANGMPRDIKVIRPLGLGLDEKAIEAVSHWRFRPGMKGGRPVATQANIEVNFRLL